MQTHNMNGLDLSQVGERPITLSGGKPGTQMIDDLFGSLELAKP